MERETTLEKVWSEEELIKKFGLKQGVTGRSASIGHWITKGLPYIALSSRRYFFEYDVVAFMEKFRKVRKFSAGDEQTLANDDE
jgi:hypothetical protein